MVMNAHDKELVSLSDVKWVFFDMGGVLVDSEPLFPYIAENLYPMLNVKGEFLRERVTHHFAKLKSEGRFKSVKRLFYESFFEIAKELQLESTLAQRIADEARRLYIEFFASHVQLYPDALTCLEALRSLGFKLGVISDADCDVLKVEMERLDILKYFNVIVASSKVRSYKPSPKIFNSALKLAHCRRGEAAYIGDAEVDVGSKQAGFIFILLDRRGERLAKQAYLNADVTISNLCEVVKLFSLIHT
jgi:HAD superfamily hydrolase (TIGR01549 family)